MSEQAKQLAQLKQQILEQISEEELETAVGAGAKEDYITVKPDDFVLNHPIVYGNTGVRYESFRNTGVRYPNW